MSAPYNTLHAYADTHKVVLKLVESLTDEQLRWKPAGYTLSIGFHVWHLARESDYLIARILQLLPQLGPEFGDPQEIWAKDGLAEKWGFPPEAHQTVGTGLSDEVAANLPLPDKDTLLDYLRRAYAGVTQFVTLLDERYATFDNVDEEFKKKIENIRLNLLVFMNHDNRHLGMMECLKGLLTGRGTATA